MVWCTACQCELCVLIQQVPCADSVAQKKSRSKLSDVREHVDSCVARNERRYEVDCDHCCLGFPDIGELIGWAIHRLQTCE